MMLVKNKMKPEQVEEKCGFVEGKGTTDAIYFFFEPQLNELWNYKKEVYLCFIKYTKAFDRV